MKSQGDTSSSDLAAGTRHTPEVEAHGLGITNFKRVSLSPQVLIMGSISLDDVVKV